MRSCRRELATRGNLGEAEGVTSYSLLCLVPGWFRFQFPESTRMYFQDSLLKNSTDFFKPSTVFVSRIIDSTELPTIFMISVISKSPSPRGK